MIGPVRLADDSALGPTTIRSGRDDRCTRVSAVRARCEARFAGLPAARQERIQDAGLAVALAGINVVSVLPYRSQLHPLLAPPCYWSWPRPCHLAGAGPGRSGSAW